MNKVAVLVLLLVEFCLVEDAFTWKVSYGDVYPLGFKQQGILINGQFAGPAIETVTNENLTINVFNNLEQELRQLQIKNGLRSLASAGKGLKQIGDKIVLYAPVASDISGASSTVLPPTISIPMNELSAILTSIAKYVKLYDAFADIIEKLEFKPGVEDKLVEQILPAEHLIKLLYDLNELRSLMNGSLDMRAAAFVRRLGFSMNMSEVVVHDHLELTLLATVSDMILLQLQIKNGLRFLASAGKRRLKQIGTPLVTVSDMILLQLQIKNGHRFLVSAGKRLKQIGDKIVLYAPVASDISGAASIVLPPTISIPMNELSAILTSIAKYVKLYDKHISEPTKKAFAVRLPIEPLYDLNELRSLMNGSLDMRAAAFVRRLGFSRNMSEVVVHHLELPPLATVSDMIGQSLRLHQLLWDVDV